MIEVEDQRLDVGRSPLLRRFDAERFLRFLLLICAAGFAMMYVIVALARVVYPFDIDFVEDGMLMQALRVAQGQPVFLPPNAEFVPHVYMPLYTWLGGLLLKLFEPGFAPLRLLSMTATMATAFLIYIIARRESKRGWIALVCAALFLAGYGFSGGWYELARVDALFVTLTLGGVACAIYADRSTRGLFLSGVLLGLSFLTKQNGLVFALAVLGYLLFMVGRRSWVTAVTFVFVSLTPILILHLSTDGWFSTYVFGIAYANPLERQRVFDTLRFDWFGSMLILSASLLVLLSVAFARRKFEQPWPLFILFAIGVSVLGRASVGGNVNNLMPGYAFLCLVPALLQRWLEGFSAARSTWAIRLLPLVLLIQFGLCLYNPVRYIPNEAMYRSSQHLIERVASIEGEVLVMLHPFYAQRAGKAPSAQIAAMWHARWRGRDPLPADFVARIQDGHYAAIVSDESLFESEPVLLELIETHYIRVEQLGPTGMPPTLDIRMPHPLIYLARR